jgi:excisionase family DNA binding protein
MQVNFDSLPQVVHELIAKIDDIMLLLQSAKPDVKQGDLLTIQEAASFLNLSKHTLYNKVNKSELPYMKKGKRLYFSRTELVDYIKSGKISSIQEIQEQTNNFLSKNSRI